MNENAKNELISIYFDESTSHGITETWGNLSLERLKDLLDETLDLFHDDDGNRTPPDEFAVKSRFGKWISGDFAKRELDRMNRNWKLWNEILAELERGPCVLEKRVDEKRVLKIKVA